MQPITLKALIDRFLAAHPHLPGPMYRTTANHIARLLGKDTLEEVLLTYTAKEIPARLEQYLSGHPHSSPSKIANNKTQAKRLVEWGIAEGLIPSTPYLSPSWQQVWAKGRSRYGTKRSDKTGLSLLLYCTERGIEPHSFTADDFLAWRKWYLGTAAQEQAISIVRSYVHKARAFLADNAAAFPRLAIADTYIPRFIAIPLHRWPEEMRAEWAALTDWLTRPQVLGRGRPWSLKTLKVLGIKLAELYGFLGARGTSVSSLREMMAREHVEDFIRYKFEERNNSTRTVLHYYNHFRKVLDHLRLPSDWIIEAIEELPAEDIERGPVSPHNIPPYTLLETFPTRIDIAIAATEQAISTAPERHERWKLVHLALLWRLKLVVLFLLYLSWRIDSIMQLRLGTVQDLRQHQAPRCSFTYGLLYQDPADGRWKFFFCPRAAKNRRVVRGEVPERIVPTLERYRKEFRPRLATGNTDLVFPNSRGKVREREGTDLITRESFRYLGVAVSPHKFRHAFAFHFLSRNPREYLALSRYLWHRDVEVTIQTYGGYEPEHALEYIEQWRAQQASEAEPPERPAPQVQRAPLGRPLNSALQRDITRRRQYGRHR